MLKPVTLMMFLAGIVFVVVGGLFCWYLYRWRCKWRSFNHTASRDAAIVAASGEGVLEIDERGFILYANPTALRLSGYEMAELLNSDYRQLLHVETVDQHRDASRIGYTTDMLTGSAAQLRCRNGRSRPVEYHMVPLPASNERRTSLLAFRDFTERARVDVMLADMQHLAQVGAWELDAFSKELNVSEAISRALGIHRRRVPYEKVMALFPASARETLQSAVERALTEGERFDVEVPVIVNGATLWVRCIGRAERIDGFTARLYGAVQDVTERRLAQRRLGEMRDFFGATLDALPLLILHIDQQGRVTYANHSSRRSLLGPVPEYIGASIADLLADPQYTGLLLSIQRILEGRVSKQDLSGPFRIEGQTRELRIDLVPALDAAKQVNGCFVVLDDVTDLKLLESRLRKAEKMQAIGQLTGGVAHDFNNLLGVILGNLQLLERDVTHDPLLTRKLSAAMRAAIRGGELTRSLLAFARHQVLEPVIVNLHRHLESVVELLQRTLDDTIELTLSLPKDLWYAQVDPGQLDNAVLNLVINARDAMPEGGRLILSARNISAGASDLLRLDLQPGDYIEVAVRDTGVGIPPAVLPLVFEPFFTTKETGKGSGLGLSIVQGFAKQSGGTAAIESQQGIGTVVRLLLPRCTNDMSLDQDTLIQRPMPHGSETILVVEDDPDLRATATLALQQLGYEVKEASNGKVAMRLLREIPHIDMLFTDLVMPGGILGPELARMAKQLKPHIRVLFTTGYAGEAALTADISAGHMLAKPYRNEELAQRVRKLLDQETAVE